MRINVRTHSTMIKKSTAVRQRSRIRGMKGFHNPNFRPSCFAISTMPCRRPIFLFWQRNESPTFARRTAEILGSSLAIVGRHFTEYNSSLIWFMCQLVKFNILLSSEVLFVFHQDKESKIGSVLRDGLVVFGVQGV